MSESITCPRCGHAFEPTALMRAAAEEHAREELGLAFDRRLEDLKSETQRRSDDERARMDVLLHRKDQELSAVQERLVLASEHEAEVLRLRRELSEYAATTEVQFQARLLEQAARIRQKATEEASQAFEMRVEEIQRAAGAERDTLQTRLAAHAEGAAELARREQELLEKEKGVAAEVERRLATVVAETRDQAEKNAASRLRDQYEVTVREREAEIASMKRQLLHVQDAEATLVKRQIELQEKEGRLTIEFERRIANEGTRLREQIEKESRERLERTVEERVRLAETGVADMTERLRLASEKELAFERQRREYEETNHETKMEAERRIAAETRTAREDALKEVSSLYLLKEEEHKLQNMDLKRRIEELQRRLDQGSQQAQGEVQEIALADVLRRAFPKDHVDDVPKGVQGADLKQIVLTDAGLVGGSILWECKRTKAWSGEWLAKLRDDQRATGSDAAVLVSQALPQNIRGFGESEGIWICAWELAVPVATALRTGLLEVASLRQAEGGRTEKIQMIYDYLVGPQFRQRVEGVVEAFVEMKDDLEMEKRAIYGLWRKRERQLERGLKNWTAVYGDLRGIAGRSMPELPQLELEGSLAEPQPDDGIQGGSDTPGSVLEGDVELCTLLLSMLPEDGSGIGNKAACERFVEAVFLGLQRDVTELDYLKSRDTLVREGRVRRGRGRGGSIARVLATPAETIDELE
jgi:hypothetical protein